MQLALRQPDKGVMKVALDGDIQTGQIHITGDPGLVSEFGDGVARMYSNNPSYLTHLKTCTEIQGGLWLAPDLYGELEFVAKPSGQDS